MIVQIETNEISTIQHLAALKANLGIDDAQLEDALRRLTLVALSEMLDMVTGRDPDVLSADTLEKRLQRLIQLYYVDRFPLESHVSKAFQITTLRATSALRNVVARQRLLVGSQLTATLRRILEGRVRREQDDVELTMPSTYLVEALKAIIETDASGYQTLSKKRLSSDTQLLSVNTYNVICARFGLPQEPVEFDG